MPIRFRCQDCRSRVKVPEGSQGKQVKCPRCGRIQSVPNRGHNSEPVGDLTVHTCVGSMHKAPKRKESLVAPAGDRFEDCEHTGGGVPGGLDIPGDGDNGYHPKGRMSRKQRRRQQARARAAQEARLSLEADITESRKRVQDLFATSHDGDPPKNDEADHHAESAAQSVARPQAIALDGGGPQTDERPDEEKVTSLDTLNEQAPREPQEDRRWTLDLTAEAYPFLKLVPWVLRVAALMLIGPAFKGMLVANEQGLSGVVSMLVLFAGLTLVAVTWTVGEIATAVRDIALKNATG
jgi:hypothetical protein